MSIYVRGSDDGQILFNRILFAFALAIKLITKVIVYSPLIFLSWLITNQIACCKYLQNNMDYFNADIFRWALFHYLLY